MIVFLWILADNLPVSRLKRELPAVALMLHMQGTLPSSPHSGIPPHVQVDVSQTWSKTHKSPLLPLLLLPLLLRSLRLRMTLTELSGAHTQGAWPSTSEHKRSAGEQVFA
jgi:hypothetical protein